MKSRMFGLFFVLILCVSGVVLCGGGIHVDPPLPHIPKEETGVKEKLSKKLLSSNLDLLEQHFLDSIAKYEKRLVIHKDLLKDCTTVEAFQFMLKKIESIEKKIKRYQDSLVHIQLLKANAKG